VHGQGRFDGPGIRTVNAARFIGSRLNGFDQPFQVIGLLADKYTRVDINVIGPIGRLLFGGPI